MLNGPHDAELRMDVHCSFVVVTWVMWSLFLHFEGGWSGRGRLFRIDGPTRKSFRLVTCGRVRRFEL